jgi:hypothetical protein
MDAATLLAMLGVTYAVVLVAALARSLALR